MSVPIPGDSAREGLRAPVVVYLISASRSGSTALALSLANREGVFTGGEFRNLPRGGLRDNGLCGCGSPLRECPFWGSVFGPDSGPVMRRAWEDPATTVANQELGSRTRYFGRTLKARPRSVASPEQTCHREFMLELYKRTAKIAGAPVLIDSSKVPVGAAELLHMPGVEAFVVHLVRDPRAVAFSVLQPKVQTSDTSGRNMSSGSLFRTCMSWNVFNLQAERLRKEVPENRFVRVKYEDVATRPVETLAGIWAGVIDAGLMQETPRRRLASVPNHTAWGNPMRLGTTGAIDWRRDDRWLTGLSTSNRRLVAATTWPLLKRYGYPLLG